jgi:uncharacterized membrane protein
LNKGRLEAFNDGVITILITIMVLKLGLAFVSQWISAALYVFVTLMWLVPDRRIESKINQANS